MNDSLLLLINGWAGHSRILDALMVFSAEYLIFILFAIALICIGFNMYKREWKSVVYFGTTLVVSYILLRLAALLNFDHRPFTDHTNLTILVAHAAGQSFPSDHTTASTAAAIGILLFTRFKKTGIVLLVLAILIGFARVFAGIHYPADILGGVATGLLGGAAVYGAKTQLERQDRNKVVPGAHK
jgi:undecaprenyl-diphosphatase